MSKEIKRLSAPLYGIDKMLRNRGKSPEQRAWDQYFIPFTNTLRNELGTEPRSYGITDPVELAFREEQLSLTRADDMLAERPPERFNLAHMQEIHRRLFAGVYPWAGQLRTVDMTKAGHRYWPKDEITARWEAHSALLSDSNNLSGILDQREFAEALAGVWGAVNHTHAFREGNTRSQTIFFAQLCQAAGWELDTARLSPHHPDSVRDTFVAGRYAYQDSVNAGLPADAGPLADALGEALTPSPATRQAALEQQKAALARQRANLMARHPKARRALRRLEQPAQPEHPTDIAQPGY